MPIKVVPYGFCHCGCGLKTTIAHVNNKGKNWIKGEPRPFVQHHHLIASRKSDEPYVVRDNGCWEWQWSVSKTGYGKLRSGDKVREAHIVMYEKKYGPVPEGLILEHFVCDNRRCVNPDHVRPVTRSKNRQRLGIAKLSDEKAAIIRNDPRPASALAAEFGVSVSLVKKVRQGRKWKCQS